MSSGVVSWWTFLCVMAAINVATWLFAAAALRRRQAGRHGDAFVLPRLQLLLSGSYVFGCAFRSALPVFDIPRLCLVDTWLSSVLVGRTVATVAELCFAAQWALLLHSSARATDNEIVRRVALAIVPLITVAEICSWYAVLTTANLGHVIENSLWGACAALIVLSLPTFAPQFMPARRGMLAAWCVAGALYIAFVFVVDVPMYWSRWVADQASGRSYLGLAQGLADASACRLVSFRWEDWKNEVAWMSLYFSAGVWASLSLVFAALPVAEQRRKKNHYQRRPQRVHR